MWGKIGIHSGMDIFQRVASYELREAEKKVVTVKDRDGGVYHLRVRAALFIPLKILYTGGCSPGGLDFWVLPFQIIS